MEPSKTFYEITPDKGTHCIIDMRKVSALMMEDSMRLSIVVDGSRLSISFPSLGQCYDTYADMMSIIKSDLYKICEDGILIQEQIKCAKHGDKFMLANGKLAYTENDDFHLYRGKYVKRFRVVGHSQRLSYNKEGNLESQCNWIDDPERFKIIMKMQ